MKGNILDQVQPKKESIENSFFVANIWLFNIAYN